MKESRGVRVGALDTVLAIVILSLSILPFIMI